MSNLPKSQEVCLELLVLFDEICRKHKLKYTLIHKTLWGAVENKGFLPNAYDARVAMLYDAYMEFLEICKEELENTPYYIANADTDPRLTILYSHLSKRSKVILPENRKNDEKFYDFNIIIIPIFNSGKTQAAYEQHLKKCMRALRIVVSREPVKGFTTYKNFLKRTNNYLLSRNNRNKAFIALQKHSTHFKKQHENVLFLFDFCTSKGVVHYRDTYKDLEEIVFENHRFYAIKQAETWLEDYFEDEYKDYDRDQDINQMSAEGPEIARRVQLVELEMLLEIDRICRKHQIKYSIFAGTLLGAVRHKGFIPWDDDVDVCMLKPDYDRFLEIAKDELDMEKYFLRTQETDKDCNLTFAQIKRNGTLYHRKARNEFNTHLGIFVDIFPLYNGTNNWFLHKFQHKMCRFTKTMLWSHMGAKTEKRFFYRFYYNQLAKVSNKKSYELYLKFATLFKDNNSKKIAYLSAYRNPFTGVFAMRDTYLDLVEIEFEGHMFFAPRKFEESLEYCYSKDYLLLPVLSTRLAKHTASNVDVGNLYEI